MVGAYVSENRKSFLWKDATVYAYKNEHGWSDGEWRLPGILITMEPITTRMRSLAIRYCESHPPAIIVFIRYHDPRATKKAANSHNITVEGYTVDKNDILDFLEDSGLKIIKKDIFEKVKKQKISVFFRLTMFFEILLFDQIKLE